MDDEIKKAQQLARENNLKIDQKFDDGDDDILDSFDLSKMKRLDKDMEDLLDFDAIVKEFEKTPEGLRGKIKLMIEMFEPYLMHKPGCSKVDDQTHSIDKLFIECTCGLDGVMKVFK